MRPVFEILPQEVDTKNTNLIFEISDCGFSYLLQNAGDKSIKGVSAYHFQKGTDIWHQSEGVTIILENHAFFSGKFNDILISYSFSDCVLIPERIYDTSNVENILKLIHGNIRKANLLTDFLPELNSYNIYKVPAQVNEVMTKMFPEATVVHQHSLLSKYNGQETFMTVIFYIRKIVVRLVNAGKVQIVQSFEYDISQDVVYHLLNVCQQFEVESVKLKLAGMIEKESALFEELHKYFLNIDFISIESEAVTDEIKMLPLHYFSHLASMT